MTKKTNAQKYQEVIDLAKANAPITEELIEFLQDRMEKDLNRNANRKPTARQLENEKSKDKIVEYLTNTEPKTATEIMKELNFDTSQKVTALLKQLTDENRIIRGEEKGKALFHINED